LEDFQKEEDVALGTKDALTKNVWVQREFAVLLEKLFQKKLKKKDVYGENMVNMEKEDIVAKKKRVCYGAKCHNKWRKCKYVGKIIKVFKKHSCAVHSYGNKSSRRKLCCQWENYCTGIRKFKCRPINKKMPLGWKSTSKNSKICMQMGKKNKTLKTKILL